MAACFQSCWWRLFCFFLLLDFSGHQVEAIWMQNRRAHPLCNACGKQFLSLSLFPSLSFSLCVCVRACVHTCVYNFSVNTLERNSSSCLEAKNVCLSALLGICYEALMTVCLVIRLASVSINHSTPKASATRNVPQHCTNLQLEGHNRLSEKRAHISAVHDLN